MQRVIDVQTVNGAAVKNLNDWFVLVCPGLSWFFLSQFWMERMSGVKWERRYNYS